MPPQTSSVPPVSQVPLGITDSLNPVVLLCRVISAFPESQSALALQGRDATMAAAAMQAHASSAASPGAQGLGGQCLCMAGSGALCPWPAVVVGGTASRPRGSGADSPWDYPCEFGAFHATVGAPIGWMGRRSEWLLQENFPNRHRGSLFSLFLFEIFLLLKPATPYKEGPGHTHSPPPQLDQGLSGSGPIPAQLSALPRLQPQSLWVLTALVCLPLRP